jgi:DNA (cytosine-5)-methyltransferase 1
MHHLDLFSGIGGFALAAQWAGIETAAFCEIDEKCHKVLNKNFPGVKIHSDINNLDGSEYAGIDIITGGYPCQPFSVAGSQKAQNDPRHLWPQMLRIITQAKPTWAICENVYGHIALGLDCVLHDLESIGYACQPFIIPALCTGANHNRERVFIVAYSAGDGFNAGQAPGSHGKANEYSSKGQKENSNNERCGSLRFGVDWRGNQIGRWGIESPPLRVDDELPNRMDRNRMLGNAIDPMIAFEIFKAIIACNNNANAPK